MGSIAGGGRVGKGGSLLLMRLLSGLPESLGILCRTHSSILSF